MKTIFIDTEFTDFKHMDLISLGAVSEDGIDEFYVEITNHIADYRSDFVNQVVMPLLDTAKYGKTFEWAAMYLAQWLDALDGDHVTVIVDYGGDWMLIEKLLKRCPTKKKLYCKFISAGLMHMLHERGIHSPEKIGHAFAAWMSEQPKYYEQDPRQHHALVDAKANRHGWLAAYEAGK